jgi:hypothetical protein
MKNERSEIQNTTSPVFLSIANVWHCIRRCIRRVSNKMKVRTTTARMPYRLLGHTSQIISNRRLNHITTQRAFPSSENVWHDMCLSIRHVIYQRRSQSKASKSIFGKSSEKSIAFKYIATQLISSSGTGVWHSIRHCIRCVSNNKKPTAEFVSHSRHGTNDRAPAPAGGFLAKPYE